MYQAARVPPGHHGLVMTLMDGAGLCRRMRAQPDLARVPIPYPFERQCPDGGLIRTALRSLLPVVGARPERFVDAPPYGDPLSQVR
jgi:hypothetical protein